VNHFFFGKGPHCVAQAGLELTILPPLLLECWDYRRVSHACLLVGLLGLALSQVGQMPGWNGSCLLSLTPKSPFTLPRSWRPPKTLHLVPHLEGGDGQSGGRRGLEVRGQRSEGTGFI
jgi:hypothetical protein